jgi:hypothetical protein
MKPRIREYRNGWSTLFERLSNGMYWVHIRRSNGDLHDKIRCDDYKMACDYHRAFSAIARAA